MRDEIQAQVQAVSKKLNAVDGMIVRFPRDMQIRRMQAILRTQKADLLKRLGAARGIKL